jgi:glycosyltransferase involved in cell wall biosynthesis
MNDPEVETALQLSLVTLGDPNRQTGGYRYHRLMADAAPSHRAVIRFASIPDVAWPAGLVAAGSTVRALSDRSDAVLLDSIAAASAAPWLRRVRTPVVAIVHQRPGGVGHRRIRSRIQSRLDRSAYRRATGLIVAAESLAEDLERAGVPSERIRVVHPGCDLPVEPGPPLNLRRGRGVAVLCVANWSPTKGITELLDAFATLPDDAAMLWLVGAQNVDRAYTNRVRQRVRSPDLSHRVVVTGAQPIERIGRFYRSADAFAMCSTVDAYGTAWAEAIAAGLPVVGWRTANLPRLAGSEQAALMAEPGDTRGLADALETIATDASVRKRLAAGARRRAQTLPTWRRSAARFFAAVRELLRTRTHDGEEARADAGRAA